MNRVIVNPSVDNPLPVFTPVKSLRTFEEAVQQIAEAVRSADLVPGDKLPSERALAEALEISRPTLRDAIKVLSQAEILEVKPGPAGGTFVRSDRVPLDLIEARSALRVGEVLEVLEARRVLEPRVAQLAALYGTEDDFAAMQQTIDDQIRAVDDRERMSYLDYRFHRLMSRATKNSMISKMMGDLLRRLEIARDMAQRSEQDSRTAIEIHIRTLEAVRGGDMDEIEEAMDEHLRYLEDLWEQTGGRPRVRTVPDFLVARST